MAERVTSLFCSECIHLRMKDPKVAGQMALYNCTSQKRGGYVVGWCSAGKKPIHMGGSCCNRIYIGDVIVRKSRFDEEQEQRYLYCGKVSKGKRLLYCKSTHEYHVVSDTWFRGQIGRLNTQLSILKQNEVQQEASIRIAKKRKQRWCEKYESS